MEEGDGGLNATVLADIFYFHHLSRNLSLSPVLGANKPWAASWLSLVADPDLQKGGGGAVIQTPRYGGRGGAVSKTFFRPFGPHWCKNKGEDQAPQAPPLDPPLVLL